MCRCVQIFSRSGEGGSNQPGEQPRGGSGYHQARHADSATDHGATCHDQQAEERIQRK